MFLDQRFEAWLLVDVCQAGISVLLIEQKILREVLLQFAQHRHIERRSDHVLRGKRGEHTGNQ